MERSAQLIAGYLDRDLSDPDVAELLTRLDAEPGLRAELVDLARLDRQLAAELGPVDLVPRVMPALARPDHAWVEQVMHAVRRAPARPRRRVRRRGRAWPVLVALAAVLVLGLALWWPAPRTFLPAAPALAVAIGDLRGVAGPLAPGSAVPSGTEISTGAAAGGVRFADGTEVMFDGGSAAGIGESAAGGKLLDLRRGRLTAEVAPQPEGRPLVACATDLYATVVGTRFTLAAAPEAGLAVEHGAVRVRLGGIEELVAAGAEVRVRGGGLRCIDWSLAGRWAGTVTAGRIMARDGRTTVASVGTTSEQRNPWFEPDQDLCIQGGGGIGRVGLAVLPQGFHLRLCLRAARAGEAMVTLEVLAPGGRPGGSGRFAVGPDWREFDLDAAGLAIAPIPPGGLHVRSVSCWGFGAGTLELAELTIERERNPGSAP